ncbi:MAG: magnesium transporter [Marinibacterium sp.]|nr:magnesium transporter [Marinibacterium sp.]
MLRAYGITRDRHQVQRLQRMPGDRVDGALWIDLNDPQPDDIAAVRKLGVRVPSRERLSSIELSQRLYRDGAAEYMTVAALIDADQAEAQLQAICFILTDRAMVSVRYHHDDALDHPVDALVVPDHRHLFLSQLDHYVGAVADRLEHWGQRMREEARVVYDDRPKRSAEDLRRALVFFGRASERLALIHLSLSSVERVMNHYALLDAGADGRDHDPMLRRLERDVAGILAHTDFLAARAASILDATLGLIDLDQNKSVSMLSAVVSLFAPATLIASVYGMNFERMPELHEQYGFAIALGSMGLSALITFLFFKWRGWM